MRKPNPRLRFPNLSANERSDVLVAFDGLAKSREGCQIVMVDLSWGKRSAVGKALDRILLQHPSIEYEFIFSLTSILWTDECRLPHYLVNLIQRYNGKICFLFTTIPFERK